LFQCFLSSFGEPLDTKLVPDLSQCRRVTEAVQTRALKGVGHLRGNNNLWIQGHGHDSIIKVVKLRLGRSLESLSSLKDRHCEVLSQGGWTVDDMSRPSRISRIQIPVLSLIGSSEVILAWCIPGRRRSGSSAQSGTRPIAAPPDTR
jgi:hypothetical protein